MPGPSGSSFSPPGGYGPGNTVSIEVEGLTRLLGRFKQAKAGLAVQAARLEEVIADEIKDAAKDLVAIDTEKTKDSIRVERRQHTVVTVDRFGDRPEVPIYLEIGTYRMAARPFLKPAADLVLASRGLQRGVMQIGGLLPPNVRR
jgi:hypothetical protein